MGVRIFAASGLVVVVLFVAGLAFADTTNLSPTSCDQLFNLPQGTITTTASAQYLNTQTCSAYQYLIARYNPGNCSTVGFSNPKVQGITSLNPQFAQNLANMLQAANAAGYNITINSAFRTPQGEQCANPGGFGGNSSASMHTKGLAADLQYPNDPNSAKGCDSGPGSAAYQWVAANARRYGVGLYDQLHSRVSGECNHVEAATAVAGGIGPGGGGGVVTTTQPSPTSGVIGATQNPLLSSQASGLTTSPFSSSPIAATPVTGATQSGQTCTPQYYCSANAVYYESSACTTQVFQQCQYGCSGTICAPAPSSASSTSSTQQSGSSPTLTTAPALTTTSLATSTSIALNASLTQAEGEPGAQGSPVITTIASGTIAGTGPEVGQSTFPLSNNSEPIYQSSSPLSGILQLLKNALTELVSYLNSL